MHVAGAVRHEDHVRVVEERVRHRVDALEVAQIRLALGPRLAASERRLGAPLAVLLVRAEAASLEHEDPRFVARGTGLEVRARGGAVQAHGGGVGEEDQVGGTLGAGGDDGQQDGGEEQGEHLGVGKGGWCGSGARRTAATPRRSRT